MNSECLLHFQLAEEQRGGFHLSSWMQNHKTPTELVAKECKRLMVSLVKAILPMRKVSICPTFFDSRDAQLLQIFTGTSQNGIHEDPELVHFGVSACCSPARLLTLCQVLEVVRQVWDGPMRCQNLKPFQPRAPSDTSIISTSTDSNQLVGFGPT